MTTLPEDQLVFAHAVEAMYYRALEGRIGPQLREAIRAEGIDLGRPLLPGYPFKLWVKTLEVTASHLYPHLSLADAFFEMGQLMVTSYQETMIGKAMFMALRILPARRIVNRMARNFRTSNNFTEVNVTETGVNTVDLAFNQVEPQPTFTQGILAAGLPAAGVKTAKVELVKFDGNAAIYRVSWS